MRNAKETTGCDSGVEKLEIISNHPGLNSSLSLIEHKLLVFCCPPPPLKLCIHDRFLSCCYVTGGGKVKERNPADSILSANFRPYSFV